MDPGGTLTFDLRLKDLVGNRFGDPLKGRVKISAPGCGGVSGGAGHGAPDQWAFDFGEDPTTTTHEDTPVRGCSNDRRAVVVRCSMVVRSHVHDWTDVEEPQSADPSVELVDAVGAVVEKGRESAWCDQGVDHREGGIDFVGARGRQG